MKLPEFPKKRLIGENRIARVEIKSCPERRADFAESRAFFSSRIGLPSPVLVDKERDLASSQRRTMAFASAKSLAIGFDR